MPIQKHALVVDDSKSARLVLRRMLEKYTLAVDTANSASEALEYLIHNRPDVIFMDHMMPGMDGFEAVKAIKNNPATATIPILMYTSKGGDLYLSQARALGAAGILPKSVAPAELFDSLERLGLVNDRREESASTDDEPASERALDIHQRSTGPASFYDPEMSVNTRAAPPDELDTRIRKLLEEQRVELRKDILVCMESVAKRVGTKFDHELEAKLEQLAAPVAPAAQTSVVPGVLLSILLFASLAWNYSLYQDIKSVQSEPVSGKAPVAVPQPTSRIEPLAEKTAVTAAPSWAFLDWAMNQTMAYPYDEIALDKSRLDTVDALLERLADSGFKGKVVLQTHAGEFCMLGNADSGYRLPPPELPIDKCAFIGNPVQPADTSASHQSLAFANFYNSTPYLAEDSPIRLEINALPRSTPLVVYPERLEGTKALDWNSAAEKNNRVIFRLEPQ
jgi:CheY-like chemotaxis protein